MDKNKVLFLVGKIFDKYNVLYFENSLPKPSFDFMRTKKAVGRFTCTRLYGYRIINPKIKLSTYYNFDNEAELTDIVLHEMIHYYIAYNNIWDNNPHGVTFRKYMRKLNDLGNHNITIYSDKELAKEVTSYLLLFFSTKYQTNILIKVGKKHIHDYISGIPTVFGIDYHSNEKNKVYFIESTDKKFAFNKANQGGRQITFNRITEDLKHSLLDEKVNKIQTFSLPEKI